MDKNELRKSILSLRSSLNSEELYEKSAIIGRKIIEKIISNNYDIILSYADFKGEVKTNVINEFALKNDLKLYLPSVIDKKNSIMEFYLVSTLEKLKEGHYGILEPSLDNKLFNYEKLKDHKILMIVPGVCFDSNLHRIGYGKGFYDKFLINKPLIYKTAVAMDIQVVDNITCDSHDIRMNEIITETKIYK